MYFKLCDRDKENACNKKYPREAAQFFQRGVHRKTRNKADYPAAGVLVYSEALEIEKEENEGDQKILLKRDS